MDHKTIIRHTLATLGYRFGYAIHNAPEPFFSYRPTEHGWDVTRLITHIVQLLTCPKPFLTDHNFIEVKTEHFRNAIEQLYIELDNLDQFIDRFDFQDEELFLKTLQGPILDAMTHVGQMMLLRRLAGYPKAAREYDCADIRIGTFKYDY